MGELARSVDWGRTPLGPVERWSQALCSTVSLVLHNHSAMLLWWGRELVQIYNDAYRPVLGDKHPRAMGQRVRECWTEIWDIIGPMIESPLQGGPASTSDDLLLPLRRKPFLEEAHFRVAYSPVPDDTAPNGIGGVLATITETTEQVYAERQLRTLRELGARRFSEVRTAEAACAVAAGTLADDPWDVPFALFYLIDGDGSRAHRVASAGFEDGPSEEVAPASMDFARSPAGASPWPLERALREQQTVTLEDLSPVGALLPASPWWEKPRTALVLPLATEGRSSALGVLVCGVSPHRRLDDGYRTFLEVAAAQVAVAIQRARALEEARERAEELARLDRAKTAFFSNVSHEFRTPLTLMLGPSEDLLSGKHGELGESQRIEVERIQRSAVRLEKLVNALLDFSRIEAGRLQASYEPVDLAELTRDLASAFRAAVERAGLSLVVDCPPLAERIWVDREMWERIVSNLLSNALKFTFEGKIEVTLCESAGGVTLRVRDTGSGVPEHELPRLFERFHRVEGARARTQEGSGIGLALVQELVRLHGGSVEAESRLGQGSCFTVRLPKGHLHLPAERLGARRPRREPPIRASHFVEEALGWLPAEHGPSSCAREQEGELGRVLVADDNADMRDHLRRLLEPCFEVELARDGQQALESALARPPDVVLTDVMMPRLDGFALLRELRAQEATRSVPVVMLSARAGEEARVEGLELGADDYLVKPFSARELLARVRGQVELARLRRGVEGERDRLRALLAQAPAIICFLRGPDLVLEFVHPIADRILRGRARVGLPLLEAVPELRGQDVLEMLQSVVVTGESFEGKERLVRLDMGGGEHVETFWNFALLPVKSAAGEVEGAMVFAIEATEQVQARRRVEQSVAELERAVRFSELFIGVLGHDLRTPLSAITTAAEVLSRCGEDSERIGRATARILNSADRMERMIGQLLDFTRIRMGGGIPLTKKSVDLSGLCRGIVEELEASCGREIRLVIEGDATGSWDPDRLSQFLTNLVANACHHSPGGTAVELVVDGSRADCVRFSVRNQGTIDPDVMARLFEPMPGRSTRRAGSGLGLGLHITQQIVLAHGGSIRADSDPNRGTTFVAELPRRAPAGAEVFAD